MRIATVVLDPGIPVFGTKGASVHVQEVVRALRAEGHQVTVHCVREGEHRPADLADLPVRRHRLAAGDGAARERAVAELSAVVAAEIDAAGTDLVHERYSLFADVGSRTTAPLLLEVNAPLVEEQRTHRRLHDEAAARAATRRQLAAARLISCVSAPVARWAVQEGADPVRTVVTPNGVNTARIVPRDRWEGEAPDTVTVGFVGTLKPWHGTDLLLRALARTRGPLRLDVCGTGPEQPALEALAAELGLTERVLFRGAVPPEQVPAVLRGLDVAVAPYPPGEHYFSPLKAYEYLAAGLPVVASAIGELPELLRDGELGVLVPPGDVDALAAALDALAADPARRERTGARAREVAVAEHDWRRRCRDLLEQVAAVGAPA